MLPDEIQSQFCTEQTKAMEENFKAFLVEVSTLQSTAAVLVEDMTTERKRHKDEKEALLNCITELKYQIGVLEQENKSMKEKGRLCRQCSLPLSGNTQGSVSSVSETHFVNEYLKSNNENVQPKNEATTARAISEESQIRHEIEDLGNFDFFKEEIDIYDLDTGYREEIKQTSGDRQILEEIRNNSPPERNLEHEKTLSQTVALNPNTAKKPSFFVPETLCDDFMRPFSQIENERTPQKVQLCNRAASPVFIGARKTERNEEKKGLSGHSFLSPKSSPVKCVDIEKLKEPNSPFRLFSPGKRLARSSIIKKGASKIFKEPSVKVAWIRSHRKPRRKRNLISSESPRQSRTPKRARQSPRRTPKKISPRKKPAQLRRGNILDVEITSGGVRKFKQTVLNMACFSQPKSQEKEEVQPETKNDHVLRLKQERTPERIKLQVPEEDDLILESPDIFAKCSTRRSAETKTPEKFRFNLESPNIFAKPSTANCEARYVETKTPEKYTVSDPDETLISASLMRKLEYDQKPYQVYKEPDCSYDRVTELESTPFAYQRGPVRKKVDRMKLPGQICEQCAPHFEKVKGQMTAKEYEKYVHECSKHRDKQPVTSDTPPVFWKPYISPTPKKYS